MKAKIRKATKRIPRPHHSIIVKWFLAKRFWQQCLLILMAIVLVFTTVSYGVAQWYILRHKDQPLMIGATFVPRYARFYGLEPKETLTAMITDLDLEQLRLVSYWDEIEPQEGTYNFSELDWQFAMAEANDVKVSLALGLRQPRWPECHMPKWAETLPMEQWEPKLKKVMQLVVERYKSSPALQSYQLENEFFLKAFGDCPDHSRERLVREYEFVKQLDATRPTIITRSNNALGLPLGEPRPNKFGVSVYKRVWDKTLSKRYFEYPLPPWFYGSLAGYGEIFTGRDLIIHELQTEAWLPDTGQFQMNDINSIPEQNKSLDAERLKKRIDYGVATGMRSIDLWGAEWWYWRKTKANDPSLWDAAKVEIDYFRSE